MADIGVDLGQDQLVLTRGRDFKWTFTNLDDNGDPLDYPDGELYFELLTGGHTNALQQISILRANGGTYTLDLDGHTTTDIGYYDRTSNPFSINTDIEDKLGALPNIGVGNVSVKPASLVPVWSIDVSLGAGANEVQHVALGSASSWNFYLLFHLGGTHATAPIAKGASAGTVQAALELLPNIGAGNVSVTTATGGYDVEFIGVLAKLDVPEMTGAPALIGVPNTTVTVTTPTPGLPGLSDATLDLVTTTTIAYYGTITGLTGVTAFYEVHDAYNATLLVTSLKQFTETALITANYQVTGSQLLTAYNAVDDLADIVTSVEVFKYWNHYYQVEFVGDLANRHQNALVADVSDLDGLFSDQSIEVDTIEPGSGLPEKWSFSITGPTASIKIESDVADVIEARTKWQLVFLPDGEPSGGDPIARGIVKVQPPR